MFGKFFEGLNKTRKNISSAFNNVFSSSEIDEDFYDEITETLILCDVGVDTTLKIIDELKEQVESNHIKDVSLCKDALIDIIKSKLKTDDDSYVLETRKSLILLIGVNGAGKTTTCGKLGYLFKNMHKNVIMACCDTFRAGAVEQLEMWASKVGVSIVTAKEGGDPGAVLYDAIDSFKAKDMDMILCDTAGRLHNKTNLMQELEKLKNIANKQSDNLHVETLLVVDGTTGQNALIQAKEFKEAVGNIDGIVITKLDGSSKGGIVIAINDELHIPVKYVGLGEKESDLQKFNADDFVDAMFGIREEE